MQLLATKLPQKPTDWAVFGVILAVVIAVMMLVGLYHSRRRKALLAAAGELGLAPVDLKSPDAQFVHELVKGQRSPKIRLCAVGFLGDQSARLAEYTYVTGYGKHSRTWHSLQVSLECPESWPAVHLGTAPGFMNRPISDLFKGRNPVTEDAAFDKRWQPQGNVAEAARMLTPELRAYLMQGEKTELWSIKEGWITCTWRRACKTTDLPRLIGRVQQARSLVAAAVGG
jgi:hypothetical protein